MKEKKWALVLFIMVFMFPVYIYAAPKVVINGNDAISSNETVDFTVSMKSDDEKDMVKFESTLKYDSEILELTSIIKDDKWSGSNSTKSTGNNLIVLTNSGVTGQTNVVIFRFKVKNSNKSFTTISLEDIKVTVKSNEVEEPIDTAESIETVSNIRKDINIKSDDNTIKSIKINSKELNGFISSVYNYTIEVDSLIDNIKIDAILNDPNTSKFDDEYGPRTENLEYGSNKILLKTISESGKSATYTINIIRKDDRVANTDLKNIIINGGQIKINFDKSVLSYTVKTFKLETIEISADADDSTSKVSIDAPKKLIIGDNKVKITVTAVTGDTKEYNLLIVNTEVATDTRLKNLSVKGINIGFNSDKYKYIVRYDKKYKEGLTIYQTTLSNDTEVEILGNTNLKAGDTVKIVVNALDGSSISEYYIYLEKDTRINFFLILDIVVGLVLIVLIIIQVKKRKKIKEKKIEEQKEEELEKTKEMKL
ncbi:MAG: cadherin-like beta sandwich domain-containing protein [bacterium]|nr:cadherin-like beta sandwich domain-containing protein [bacterium]